MNHNDVARRTAHTLPARSLPSKAVACDGEVEERTAVRALTRELPARALVHSEGGR